MQTVKVISITIPQTEFVPEIIHEFSPKENYLMIKIGSDCLKEGRLAIAGFSQQEIYKKIKEEYEEQIHRLEMDVLVEKEMHKKYSEEITKLYKEKEQELKNKQQQLEEYIQTLKTQIKSYELENNSIIQKEVERAKEKYELLLQEKDRQNQLNRDAFDKAIQLTNKSTTYKGSEGEKTFCEYAETFQDFKGFDLIDKHTQGGQGDFHLHFEEFDVLVDAKNYKKKVPIDQREKIRKDLLKNEHLHFAWLVSLNTTIDKFDKSPIMYEWINTTQCIVYINNLSSFEDPKKILRIVWFTCKELHRLIEEVHYDGSEFSELKEKNYKFLDKVKVLRKTIREVNTSMNATRNLIQLMDNELREILETETAEIVSSHYSLFDDWWKQNIMLGEDTKREMSTTLWSKFKQDNKLFIKDMDITVDKFKQYIKSKVPLSSLIIKNKNSNSAFEIKGILLKNAENKVIEEGEKIEVDFFGGTIKK